MLDKLRLSTAAFLSKSLTRLIKLDPAAVERLEKLEGKSLLIQFTDISFSLFFNVNAGELYVADTNDENADAILSGDLAAFVALFKNPNSALKTPIHYQGDIHCGQDFQQLFQGLDIDWEEILAQLSNDMFAHSVMQGFVKLRQGVKRVFYENTRNAQEFFTDEVKVLPHPNELADFGEQVETLRDDVERLSARIRRLSS